MNCEKIDYYFPFSLVLLTCLVDVPCVREHLGHAELSLSLNVLVLHVYHQVKLLPSQVPNVLLAQTGHRSVAMNNPLTVCALVLERKYKLLLGNRDIQAHVSVVQGFSVVEPVQVLIHQLFGCCCCHSVPENYGFWLLPLEVSGVVCQYE